MSKLPLAGVKVLEIAGLAPAPFAGLILADFGADVVRVDRQVGFNADTLSRGKKSISINLKSPKGIELFKKLCEKADVVIEPFRPGVMEKLGLGPDVLCKINPSLIFARLTGFGQTGPYAKMAGHDINYIAVSGALSLLGRKDENPIFPSNLLGDFAGGGMACALGIIIALYERSKSNKGQVVDSAMIDNASYLSSFIYNAIQVGMWDKPRGENLLDTGAHFYETYKTKDGKYMAVGAIEPEFYQALLKGLGLEGDKTLPSQMNRSTWPDMKEKFKKIFESKTRTEWEKIFDGTDACCTPVLEFSEVETHPHAQARKIVKKSQDDTPEIAHGPRLSRTPGVEEILPRPNVGEHTEQVLQQYGFSQNEIQKFLEEKIVSKL